MKINHPNVVKCIEYKTDAFKVKQNGPKRAIAYIVMDFA